MVAGRCQAKALLPETTVDHAGKMAIQVHPGISM